MNNFRLLIVGLLLLIGSQTMSQDTIPPFFKNKQLPAFELLLTDSSKYNSNKAYRNYGATDSPFRQFTKYAVSNGCL